MLLGAIGELVPPVERRQQPYITVNINEGYCLSNAWHRSSVVMKTVYVRRKSSSRVSVEENKRIPRHRKLERGVGGHLFLMACKAVMGAERKLKGQELYYLFRKSKPEIIHSMLSPVR